MFAKGLKPSHIKTQITKKAKNMKIKIQLNKTLAKRVSMHFFAVLIAAIGLSACLAFMVTAKWYMVLFTFAVLAGGWFVLYKLEEGWELRKLQS